MGHRLSPARRQLGVPSTRSIFSRFVLAAIVLATVTVLGLWLITERTIDTALNESAREAVDVDLAGLADIYASGGEADLVQRIEDRLALRPADGSAPHYLLMRPDGARLAGDIETWPDLDAAISERGTISIGHRSSAHARSTRLGPGAWLLVAHEVDPAAALKRGVRTGFLVGGFLLVLVVAMLGKLSADRLKRRIARINRLLSHPDELASMPELPRQGRDEIDELAASSAGAILRIRGLLEAHSDTTDRLAHEIRTPLTHLDARLVKALETRPDEQVTARLTEARGEIRRLVSMLESLLDIAWSKARLSDRSTLKPVDLSALVTNMCELYVDSAEDAGLSLEWDVQSGIVMDGDSTQLGRLLANLLDNALKYVPTGGTVRVALHDGPVLVVADDGPGIPKADRTRIFERFQRGPGSKAGEGRPGAGLGLALASAIAQRHAMILECLPSATGAIFQLRRETP